MSDQPNVRIGDRFFESLEKLQGAEQMRVTRAVNRFKKNPQSKGLNLEQIRRDQSCRLYSIRASDELRVLLARVADDWVFLEVGHHDDLYLRAMSGQFIVRSDGRFMGLVTSGDGGGDRPPRHRVAAAADEPPNRRVFDHWTDAELARAGFTATETEALRSARSHTELLDLDIDEEKLLLAIDLVEITPEQWFTELEAAHPERARRNREKDALDRNAQVWGLSEVLGEEELDRVLAQPIEDWMLFLHPLQRSFVRANHNGPARIFGPAGTGKTVVALHRAAELAHRFRAEDPDAKILFTTYIRSLPPVFEALYNRLPNSIEGAVEFVNIDSLARRVAKEGGPLGALKVKEVDAAFTAAHRAIVKSGSALKKAKVPKQYLRDECESVIKGRGIQTIDEYLTLERVGRRTPFPEALRREVWKLHTRWLAEMDTRKTITFADVTLAARDHARTIDTARYRAAIIDEAQDLTLAGLQLIQALVFAGQPPRPDSLLLVGDGAQRIYPSCYTLKEAGVDVRNRSTRLEFNYRNSAEIIAVAKAICGDIEVDDLEERFLRGDALAPTDLHSARPELVVVDTEEEVFDQIAAGIREFERRERAAMGDVAVLAATNAQVRKLEQELSSRGLATVNLSNVTGATTLQVKVGTFFRAKGLEFKVVFIPWMTQDKVPPAQRMNESSDSYRERVEMFVSTLFVAMTRARDHLVLMADGPPTGLLDDAREVLEVHGTWD